jgi:hypothetical protein
MAITHLQLKGRVSNLVGDCNDMSPRSLWMFQLMTHCKQCISHCVFVTYHVIMCKLVELERVILGSLDVLWWQRTTMICWRLAILWLRPISHEFSFTLLTETYALLSQALSSLMQPTQCHALRFKLPAYTVWQEFWWQVLKSTSQR